MTIKIITITLLIIGFGCNTSNRNTNSFNTKVHKFEFSPKNYELNKMDTTINDSIRLTVKHYTLMDKYVSPYGPVTEDSIVYGYRDYAIEIELFINKKKVINEKLVKTDFPVDKKYLKNCVIYKVWLESTNIKKDQIKLRAGIGVPDSDNEVFIDLILRSNGKIKMIENLE